MLTEEDKKKLKKYRHLIAGLIYESIGYFTPLAALRALELHREKKAYFCEWYMDIAMKRTGATKGWSRDEALYLAINHDIIRNVIRKRNKLKEAYRNCRLIVDRNIQGNESIGASWF